MVPTPALSEEQLRDILSRPLSFDNFAQQEACERLWEELSDQDQEVAAQTSYAYWLAKTHAASTKDGENLASLVGPETQKRMGMKEVCRHYRGEGQNFNKALVSLRNAIAYHKKYKTYLFRLCHVWEEYKDVLSLEDQVLAQKYRVSVENDLPKQFMVARGRDVENHPILIVSTRTTNETDHDAYVLARLYIVERIVAVAEALHHERVVGVMDFGNYLSGNTPPYGAIKEMSKLLQRNYPERLHRMVILDPPVWMSSLYALIRPFLDTDTKKKFVMIKGKEQKQKVLSELVREEHATPSMMPNGKLSTPTDIMKFFRDVPFHSLYDEANN